MSTLCSIPNASSEPRPSGQLVRRLRGCELVRRGLEQSADLLRIGRVDGDARRGCGARSADTLFGRGVGSESLLNACGDRPGLVAIGAREHADELVGPETGGAVLATEDGAQHPGERLEELIAGVMAPAVVELAESVDVGHDQRERPLTSHARASSLSMT